MKSTSLMNGVQGSKPILPIAMFKLLDVYGTQADLTLGKAIQLITSDLNDDKLNALTEFVADNKDTYDKAWSYEIHRTEEENAGARAALEDYWEEEEAEGREDADAIARLASGKMYRHVFVLNVYDEALLQTLHAILRKNG